MLNKLLVTALAVAGTINLTASVVSGTPAFEIYHDELPMDGFLEQILLFPENTATPGTTTYFVVERHTKIDDKTSKKQEVEWTLASGLQCQFFADNVEQPTETTVLSCLRDNTDTCGMKEELLIKVKSVDSVKKYDATLTESHFNRIHNEWEVNTRQLATAFDKM